MEYWILSLNSSLSNHMSLERDVDMRGNKKSFTTHGHVIICSHCIMRIIYLIKVKHGNDFGKNNLNKITMRRTATSVLTSPCQIMSLLLSKINWEKILSCIQKFYFWVVTCLLQSHPARHVKLMFRLLLNDKQSSYLNVHSTVSNR